MKVDTIIYVFSIPAISNNISNKFFMLWKCNFFSKSVKRELTFMLLQMLYLAVGVVALVGAVLAHFGPVAIYRTFGRDMRWVLETFFFVRIFGWSLESFIYFVYKIPDLVIIVNIVIVVSCKLLFWIYG